MIRRALLLTTLTLTLSALGGCHLYFGDGGSDEYTYCDESGCYSCDDWGCSPDGNGGRTGAGPGWSCAQNYDCAAGCFCNSEGLCEEAGFCTSTNDCTDGFECDDRSSCVPEGSTSACTEDDDCPRNSYCEEATGTCVGSWSCDPDDAGADEACGMGFGCDDERNTCVPQPCDTDAMCQEGCYCDTDAGECIETSTCDALGGCPGDMECDTARNTCMPPAQVTCQGDIDSTCDVVAPECPVGTTPAIENGCYDGTCMAKEDCPDGAPFECTDLNDDEDACFANADCSPVYKGVNCTDPDGDQCTSGDANCTCESFTYDYCGEA